MFLKHTVKYYYPITRLFKTTKKNTTHLLLVLLLLSIYLYLISTFDDNVIEQVVHILHCDNVVINLLTTTT